MIIKSHIRGGYRSAAQYLKEIGKNETTRSVEISDPDAANLDEAFRNMWAVAKSTRATKPLHHISINPFKDERLTDEQVLKIVERAEQKYGYKPGDHQRVIVEHVLNGRQHFHVVWNRISLTTNRPVWPGEHWKKSKQICREMEQELGLKRPVPKRAKAKDKVRSRRKTNRTPRCRKVPRPTPSARSIAQSSPIPAPKFRVKVKQRRPTHERRPKRPIFFGEAGKGWPEAAVIAWESWGKHDPVRFFLLWAELAPPGFSPH